MTNGPAIVVCDIETTGLDENVNAILEVGILILDLQLQEIDSDSWIVSDDNTVAHLDWLAKLAAEEPQHHGEEPWRGGKMVHEMHQKSGLTALIRDENARGVEATLLEVQQQAVAFMARHHLGIGKKLLPMTGSSILFDRKYIAKQMPVLDSMFHYRNTDISSLKTLVQLYRPDVAERLRDEVQPQGLHRSIPDCWDTTRELSFYLSNTLLQGVAQS
ncbi:RNase H [Rhodococcus phage Mbo2]|uniref:RNase H n=1 Tax=Rhodococcus phage Mbo2 TaxID=2936911 RepID=A0A9E7IEE9_9CAUD|nr:RNase H [Rhodococcus phage Mbo2]